MTSANVTYYYVKDDKGQTVGEYRQNCMCKDTDLKAGLKSHLPHEDFSIRLRWPDENEVNQWTKEMPLSDYLLGIRPVWVDHNGDPKISYDEFVNIQKQLQSAKEIIGQLVPDCCLCVKLASHTYYDYDGETYFCKKHASRGAEEDKTFVKAIKLLNRLKR